MIWGPSFEESPQIQSFHGLPNTPGINRAIGAAPWPEFESPWGEHQNVCDLCPEIDDTVIPRNCSFFMEKMMKDNDTLLTLLLFL